MTKTSEFDVKMYKKLDSFIDSLETKEGALISVLHEAQGIFGYLPKEVQQHIAYKLEIPSSKVYGTVTFYSFFNTKPKGEYQINCCLGTACFIRGAQEIINEFTNILGISPGETTEDNRFSLDALRCVGACGLAPVLSVNGKVYGRIKPEDVKTILAEYND